MTYACPKYVIRLGMLGLFRSDDLHLFSLTMPRWGTSIILNYRHAPPSKGGVWTRGLYHFVSYYGYVRGRYAISIPITGDRIFQGV